MREREKEREGERERPTKLLLIIQKINMLLKETYTLSDRD